MAEVVVKLDSILLQERESAEASVDEGIFISRVRYIWSRIAGRGKGFTRVWNKGNQWFETLSNFAELERATNYFSEKDHSTTVGGTIYKGWVDKRTYDRQIVAKSQAEEFKSSNLVKILGRKVEMNKRTGGKTNLVKWSIPLLTDKEDFGKIIDPQLST
ncbi:hypothetical protein Tco_1040872 [Tanacetum coccineum]|uniref:Uncharacterized protein n=1 Tax=Tanacetum coccineum TaxID=301880 RepID=A0ABQ5GEL2_9ASTR